MVLYRLAKTLKMPYLKGSLSAKESYNQWLFCRMRPASCKIRYVFSPHCTGMWHDTLGAWHHILDVLNSITHSVYWISIHPTCDAIHQNTKILQASHIGCTGIGHHTLGAWHHAFGVSNCNTPNVWCQKHNHPFITNITHWVCWVIGIIQWVYWFAIYPMCDAKHPNIPFVTGITYWVYRVCGMIHWVHGVTQWVYWCAIHPVRDANHPTTQPPNHPTTQPPNHPTTHWIQASHNRCIGYVASYIGCTELQPLNSGYPTITISRGCKP